MDAVGLADFSLILSASILWHDVPVLAGGITVWEPQQHEEEEEGVRVDEYPFMARK